MDEDLITELGLEHLTTDQQQDIIDELSVRIGQELLGQLTQTQIDEYEAIINGEQPVIDAWLAANDPEYKETVAYQELSVGYDEDPEKVPADKVYASMAWVEKNSPQLAETVATIKADIKARVAAQQ